MAARAPLRRCRQLLLAGLIAAGWTFDVQADIVVVVRHDSPLPQLNAQQVSDLYLGRLRSLDGGETLWLLDQPVASSLRQRFFQRLNGMDLKRVNAYWARLQFSGDTLPPTPLADSRAVIATVSRHRLAVGYVESAPLPDGVRAIFLLSE